MSYGDFLEGESEIPQSNNDCHAYSVKFVIVGDSTVGKSNIIFRFSYNKFVPNQLATIGIEYTMKNILYNNINYEVKVFDTAGQEKHRSITRAYYKGSAVAMIVYDITNEVSFSNVERWISDCKDYTPSTALLVLIGNKSDLENERKISKEQGEQLAKDNDMIFFETSALNGNGIENAFKKCIEIIDENIKNRKYNLDDIDNMRRCGIEKKEKVKNYGGTVDTKALLEGQKSNKKFKCCGI